MGTVGGPEYACWGGSMDGMHGKTGANGGGEKMEKIFVSVRLRPLNEKEIASNDACDWECINDTTIVFKNSFPAERSMPSMTYSFDRVFGWNCSTRQVYEDGAKEVALSVVNGINSTIFAYGQTSSGKTFTMSGITEYTVADIYNYISRHEERVFVLKFSAIEIYNETVKDLLIADSAPLRLLDDLEKGTIVEKLTEETLRDWSHLKNLIAVCEDQRKIGETSLNETSSRSHQILRLTIESSTHDYVGKDNSNSLVATVNFVDLAGSERASQAMSAGTRLKEGCHINRSLLTLGTVIRKLSKGRNGHVPYRDSKLTRILQSSLGGNARTAIICTMNPARSHIEQSRNTLLFASCAKEVVTNAQVNVVMSDKTLVKHLQKELARLENKMRYSGLSPNVEDLLLEKDTHIVKMEKEIKELIQQRDLAQTKLASLLYSIEEDSASRQWEHSSQNSMPNLNYACDDTVSTSELSDVVDHSLGLLSYKIFKSHDRRYLQNESVSNPVGMCGDEVERIVDQNLHEDLGDHCKEVQCIEINESERKNCSTLTEGSATFTHLDTNFNGHEVERHKHEGSPSTNSLTLEQHLRSVRTTLNKEYRDRPALWSAQEISNSRGWILSRSRSCRSTSTNSSWFQDIEQNDTPPTRSLKEFPGRPEGHKSRLFAVNYDNNNETSSIQGSECSKYSTFITDQKGNKGQEEVAGINNFITELKEMAQAQYHQETVPYGTGTVKDIDVDLISNPLLSPSTWPREFKKRQHEIIELWHVCNVSLVHRTYFFMLFKGDPSDYIYMEVELRRLSFLKSSITRANLDKSAAIGQNANLISGSKMLQHERDMLCRKMQKQLSAEDRDGLYMKWGIQLQSKQRRLQLVRRLWSETNDLEHVQESASVVSKLIGLQEEGQALKEMFGLSFKPQHSKQRFSSWRNGLSFRR